LTKVLSADKYSSEGFLLQVFGLMQVSCHASAKPKDRLFPPLHKLTESRVVVRRLNPPHRLLVRHRDQGQQKTQLSHVLPRLVSNLWHFALSHRIFFAVVCDKTTG
jgi:hypothetical protein